MVNNDSNALDCRRQFVENPTQQPIDDPTRNLINRLLLERLALAAIARVCNGEPLNASALSRLTDARSCKPCPVNTMAVYFYSAREAPYGCFSNFSPHGLELDGLWWPTREHYFQAQKFAGTPHADQIRQVKTPKDAAKLGRDRSCPPRYDWNEVKDDIMRRGVLRKFETHASIREILLSTGSELIVENAPGDYYWGCGADGSGLNRLGQILMEVREILRKQRIDLLKA